MLQGVFDQELEVGKWERTAASKGWRWVKAANGKLKRAKVSEQVAPALAEARAARDEHLAELRHLIDYALTTDAYEDVPCPDCGPPNFPNSPTALVEALTNVKPRPAMSSFCEKCKGRGAVRARKTDADSAAAFKRISYFKRVLDTTVLCAKVRYSRSESDDAYLELEKQNIRLLRKFSNEEQTYLESDDALQGVRQGIVDAAVRFDPTRPEGANFGTVAYNWAYRNSRHRAEGQKRAGVYAPSIDVDTDDGRGGLRENITSSDGAFGSTVPDGKDPTLVLDLREKIAALPGQQGPVVMSIMAGNNIRATAQQLGLKGSVVRRLRSMAFSALRESLSGYVEVLRD
jgi:DNA-directed RNA polymerase specialized sigma24 family protein